ncbi:MAG: GNAT family N-acetyltransferase [Acidobacteria bacterium]|nr:GNAT family N-acetyltransferase [Acidobacteriota bacterium]
MLLLETQRLILRPFQDSDLEPFAEYRSDPKVARYQSWEIPYTKDQAAAFIREMKQIHPGIQGEWYQFAVELRRQSCLIGDCAFQILAHDARQAEIGFSLSRPYQGQGYAAEAVMRMLDYLFGELGLHRVTATCDAENHASAKLLERVGMRREGHFIENIWFKGAWGSEYSYALLHSEWSIRQETKGHNVAPGSGA